MKTLTLSATINPRGSSKEYTYSWGMDVPEGLTYVQQGILKKGFGELIRDAFSTFDGVEAAKDNAAQKRLEELKAGTYSFKGGSGGGYSITTKAWIKFFAQIKHKENGAAVKKATLDRAQRRFCGQGLLADNPKISGGDLDELVSLHLAVWIKIQEESEESVGGIIQLLEAEEKQKTKPVSFV